MTDSTPTPDPEDVIRRALHAEAEGVEASEALLDRTLVTASRPAAHPGLRLLAAAAVAAAAIGAVVVVAQDDDAPVDTIDDPSTTVTTPSEPGDDLGLALRGLFGCPGEGTVLLSVFVEPEGAVEVQAALQERASEVLVGDVEDVEAAVARIAHDGATPVALGATFADGDEELAARGEIADLPGVLVVASTQCDHSSGGPTGERPTTVALVREDGWLVLVDVETGEQRELHFGGDPTAPPSGQEEGGPQFIDSVDLSPDGEWVYFSTCCEPASGVTFRISVDGGEPEQIAFGAYPRVSPDGRSLATASGEAIAVTDLARDEPSAVPMSCCTRRLAWAPDGSQLAAINQANFEEPAQVVLFDWDGTSLTPADPGKPDNPGSFVAWSPDGVVTTISGGGSVDSSRSLAQDTSYRWLLWVDAEGVVREQAGLSSGELPAIAGLPEALSADW
jgi:hypothetical protein